MARPVSPAVDPKDETFLKWLTSLVNVVNGLASRRVGSATLVGGTVTVVNTSVTTRSVLSITRHTIGGTAGNLSYTTTAGTGFTISSSNALDTSTIVYEIIEG